MNDAKQKAIPSRQPKNVDKTSPLSKRSNEQGLDQYKQGYNWALQKAGKASVRGGCSTTTEIYLHIYSTIY